MRRATVDGNELTVRSAECKQLQALVSDQATGSRHVARCQWVAVCLFDGLGHDVDELSTGVVQSKERGAKHGCK